MKKISISSALAVLLTLSVSAQRKADIGFSMGVVNYVGDLGNEKVLPVSSAAPGISVSARNFLGRSSVRNAFRTFDVQVRFDWHRLQYDETAAIGGTKGEALRNYRRGLSFRNDLLGAETDFIYNIYPQKLAALWKPKYDFFLLAGVGVTYGKPKADLFRGDISMDNRYFYWADGTVRDMPESSGKGNVIKKDGVYETNLRDWHTEGQGYNSELDQKKPYSYTNVMIPLGAGFRYFYSKQLTLSASFSYYYFFTDYLDDVSGRYATFEELHASFPDRGTFDIARYISDPTGHGTNGYQGPYASVRGNPSKNDSYTFLNFEVSYRITWKKKGIYGQ